MATLLQQLNSERMKSAQTHIVKKSRKPKVRPAIRSGSSKVKSWYSRSQRGVMYVTGFGFLDAAAWQFGPTAGCAATGASLLIIGTLSGGDDE